MRAAVSARGTVRARQGAVTRFSQLGMPDSSVAGAASLRDLRAAWAEPAQEALWRSAPNNH
jgi:hypothetical protein